MADEGKQTPDPNAATAKNSDGSDKTQGQQGQENMIPQSRFNEVNTRLKEATERLEAIEKKAREDEAERLRKAGEFEKIATDASAKAKKLEDDLKAEKEIADQFRAMRSTKVEALKKDMGDAWLPEFDNLSLDSLNKLEARFKSNGGTKPGAASGMPASGAQNQKPIASMTATEFAQYKADVAAGRIKPSAS